MTAVVLEGRVEKPPTLGGNELRRPRGYLDISSSILGICLNGSLRTHVMFQANLNAKQLKTYMEWLEKKGLIEANQQGRRTYFRTSEKGRKFYAAYYLLADMVYDKGITRIPALELPELSNQ